jgi:hypothetical protein
MGGGVGEQYVWSTNDDANPNFEMLNLEIVVFLSVSEEGRRRGE